MNIKTRISEIYKVFDQNNYHVSEYKKVSSNDYTSFLIFEKEVQNQEEQEKKLICSSSLLWLVFFHDKPELMRVEHFDSGKRITEIELFNKMEELAVSLEIIREIELCDDSRLLLVDSNGIQQSLRLDILTVLCDGISIWNQRGYTATLLKQQIMDAHNANILTMVIRNFITQLYYKNKTTQCKPTITVEDLEDPQQIKEFWNRPVKDFFCNIRERLKNGSYSFIDFILQLLNDIAEHKLIMVSGEFEYLKKKI